MPRPTRFPNHPLKKLRARLGGISQSALAEITGIPFHTIQGCEGRGTRLNEEADRKIEAIRSGDLLQRKEAEMLLRELFCLADKKGRLGLAADFELWAESARHRFNLG